MPSKLIKLALGCTPTPDYKDGELFIYWLEFSMRAGKQSIIKPSLKKEGIRQSIKEI